MKNWLEAWDKRIGETWEGFVKWTYSVGDEIDEYPNLRTLFAVLVFVAVLFLCPLILFLAERSRP